MSAVQPAAPSRPAAVVAVSRRSLYVSLAWALYVVLTPMQAYLYESYPWQVETPTDHPRADANWHDASAYWLNYSQHRATFLPGAPYEHDVACSMDMHRMVLNLSEPILASACHESFVYTLNNGALLSTSLQDTLCAFAAEPSLRGVGGCQQNHALHLEVSIICMWIVPGNDVDASAASAPGVFTYYSSFRMSPSVRFLEGKLLLRMALVLHMAFLMWHQYYRVVFEAMASCQRYPASRVTLFVGDPTSLALVDIVSTTGMCLDLWLSAPVIGSAMLAVVQVDALWFHFTAYVYLSRTAWLAYAFVSGLSRVLKMYGAEDRFTPLDPTVLWLVATLVAGPLTYVQGQSSLCVQLYVWFFNAPAVHPSAIQILYALAVFFLTISLLPMLLGWRRVPLLPAPIAPSAGATLSKFASPAFNDYKHQLLWRFIMGRTLLQTPGLHFQGGGIYAFGHTMPAMRQSPCLSQRGTDCFAVLCDDKGDATACVRLSLMCTLDIHQRGLEIGTGLDDEVFGHVSIEVDKTTNAAVYRLTKPLGSCAWLE
ncbi:hypothetical protein SPRG_08448 [Saprolegnia parasitica CBS 223.65]|uniref:Uncharacterized protein n=1 Tax=Saprolegnia parasitica (strain CBS 223.65) TaxID=695850 RepID=A0A067CGZ7_SAPPC|nr:hypothetical protein SPRG_08448 [Saprolegnia parasitica CBS 223.65]KDO26087.1 hypothetical protein SPRG_08448 [Saprolegnia parasitica CBS 223.65]|eukprot:XP_012203083.1 hypothetical protein SPRG_08448 [Saprolegnia parasitica CBS 223.65]